MFRRLVMVAAGVLAVTVVAMGAIAMTAHVPDDTSWQGRLGAGLSGLAAEGGARIERGVAYGDLPRQKLDVYRPKSGRPRAVVVFLYGGSWAWGERGYWAYVGAALAARGYIAAIPDYRLYPQVKYPGFLVDCARAYGWAADHLAPRAGGDPLPMILVGHSAGAHMAARLAYDDAFMAKYAPRAPRPVAFAGLAGPYTFYPTRYATTKHIFDTAPGDDAPRPVTYVSPGDPQALLLYGGADSLVGAHNAIEFAEALRGADVPVDIQKIRGTGHAGIILDLAWPLRWRAPVYEKLMGFLYRVTSGG